MSYAYPDAASVGQRVRAALSAYRAAGGKRPVILLHGEDNTAGILAALGRGAGASVARAPQMQGLPARVIPVALHHVVSAGMDLALAFLAFGAAQVVWWCTGKEAPSYRELLEREVEWAGALVEGLGMSGRRLLTIDAQTANELESRLQQLVTPAEIATAATFAVSEDKRRTIEFSVDHLLQVIESKAAHAPIALPKGAPFGRLKIDTGACTLCLSCIGACPEKALLDMADVPGLRIIERNCVQCGLCETTCPESAITLEPRYLPGKQREESVVLNSANPLACIQCGKLFGTHQMIDAMKKKLAGHRMFGDAQMKALEMCADCRVTEMFSATGEVSVLDVRRDGL
jgi:ferredoxin